MAGLLQGSILGVNISADCGGAQMSPCRSLCPLSATSAAFPAGTLHPCSPPLPLDRGEDVRVGESQFPFPFWFWQMLPWLAKPSQGRAMTLSYLSPLGDSYGVLPRPCHALVLLNPQSGSGRALDDFQAVVQPMLVEADITTTVFVTGESMSSSSSSSFSFLWDPGPATRAFGSASAQLWVPQDVALDESLPCLLHPWGWGWGHHLGLGSLSGGWQQEGQRDGG